MTDIESSINQLEEFYSIFNDGNGGTTYLKCPDFQELIYAYPYEFRYMALMEK